jgi:OFA family oxalate/formate antiporter-like MFS transporter
MTETRPPTAEAPPGPSGEPSLAPGAASAEPPRWLGVDLVRNRWLFPAAGLLATALGGSAYAFSVFVEPLEAEFGWARAETILAFGFGMLAAAAAIFGGGFFVDRYGPRWVLAAGGGLAGTGMMLSSTVNTPFELLATFGLLVGTGIGLAYTATTVALAARWFPDWEKRGAAIGWSVVGFGIGATIAAPLWTLGVETVGWRTTYVLTGVVFLAVYALLATLVRFPPPNWVFADGRGWHPREDADGPPGGGQVVSVTDLTLAEAVRSRYLWLLGLLFLAGIVGGLIAISQLAPFVEDAPPAGLGLSVALAAAVIVVFSVHNGLGRPFAGWVSARLGVRRTMVAFYALMAVGMALLSLSTFWTPLVVLGVVATGLAFGGVLAINPIMTVMLFGISYVARIYGFVFVLGFGFGGLLGPLTGGAVYDATDSYLPAFVAGGVLAAASALLVRLLLPGPGAERQHTPRTLTPLTAPVSAPAEPQPDEPQPGTSASGSKAP